MRRAPACLGPACARSVDADAPDSGGAVGGRAGRGLRVRILRSHSRHGRKQVHDALLCSKIFLTHHINLLSQSNKALRERRVAVRAKHDERGPGGLIWPSVAPRLMLSFAHIPTPP